MGSIWDVILLFIVCIVHLGHNFNVQSSLLIQTKCVLTGCVCMSLATGQQLACQTGI